MAVLSKVGCLECISLKVEFQRKLNDSRRNTGAGDLSAARVRLPCRRSGIGVMVHPAEPGIGTEVARRPQAARFEVDRRGDPATVEVVDRVVVADRHAHGRARSA